MINTALSEDLGNITRLAFQERKITLKVVRANAPLVKSIETSQSECEGQGVYQGNSVHVVFLSTLNLKPYMGGNPNSELGPGDFLDVYQPSRYYRS